MGASFDKLLQSIDELLEELEESELELEEELEDGKGTCFVQIAPP